MSIWPQPEDGREIMPSFSFRLNVPHVSDADQFSWAKFFNGDYDEQINAAFGPVQPLSTLLSVVDPSAEHLPDGTIAPTEFLINGDGECEDNWFELNFPGSIPRSPR